MTDRQGSNPYEQTNGQEGSPGPWPVYGQQSGGPTSPARGPWPVYGAETPADRFSPGAPSSPESAGASPDGEPQAAASPPGSSPGGASGWGPPLGATPGDPYAPPQSAATPPGPTPFPSPVPPAGGAPRGDLPSRTGPILTLLGGVALMIVIAPIVFIGLIMNGLAVGSMMDGSVLVSNGGSIVIDETGAVGVVVDSSQHYSCTLTSETNEVVEMVFEADGAILAARGLEPGGTYILNCEGLTGADTMVVFGGSTLASLIPTATSAFGWATLVGFIGVGVLIWGIVWLVRRNRARREVMMSWRW